MMAEGSLTIQAVNEIHNDYSTMAAAGNLSVTAGRDIENTGYQGTIHYDDLGHDNHYWKYKKHTRMHLHCHMVCGGVVYLMILNIRIKLDLLLLELGLLR